MTYSTNSILGSASKASRFSQQRNSGALAALLLSLLAASACSAGPTSDPKGTPDGKQENVDEDPASAFGYDAEADADASGGKVTLGSPYLSGSCGGGKATSHLLADNQRYLTMLFSNQTYGGNPSDPDFWGHRSEGRLIGDARSRAPKCELHIPMTVTAGYKFSPTDVIIRGYAHKGFVFTEYRWGNSASVYNFQRQVDGDFTLPEPLYNLWSPTCDKSKGSTVSTEFVATLQPFTAEGATDSPLIAVDSFDVAGYGSIISCSAPENHNRVAHEGEACNIVDHDTVHPVRCDQTPPNNNICVDSLTNTETGTCVNQSKAPSKSELEVGFDEQCGGPFFKYCSTQGQPLVCQFRDAESRQNASSHYGKCVTPLAAGSQCSTTSFGACNGYSCNTTVDPCESGSKCSNGKCVADKTKVNAASAGDEGASAGDDADASGGDAEPSDDGASSDDMNG